MSAVRWLGSRPGETVAAVVSAVLTLLLAMALLQLGETVMRGVHEWSWPCEQCDCDR